MQTIKACIQQSIDLADVSDSPRLDVELLLAWVLDKDRTFLFTWPDKELTSAQQQAFSVALERRKAGEPIAYIVGFRDFWSLRLKVNASTLIPRPETELLVELVLDRLQKPVATVMDLGTGTGAVALAIASERPSWQVTACDVMPAAVALAEENRLANKIANVNVLHSDWYAALGTQAFDVIVSNPPYIDANDVHLDEGDVRFEPRSALVASEQGLADIRIIIEQGRLHLVPGGWIAIEHGYEQAQAVQAIFRDAGFTDIESVRDLAGHERVTLGHFAGISLAG